MSYNNFGFCCTLLLLSIYTDWRSSNHLLHSESIVKSGINIYFSVLITLSSLIIETLAILVQRLSSHWRCWIISFVFLMFYKRNLVQFYLTSPIIKLTFSYNTEMISSGEWMNSCHFVTLPYEVTLTLITTFYYSNQKYDTS